MNHSIPTIQSLLVIETHPVQYRAPVYQAVAKTGIPVSVVYGSDFSIAGYVDREFSTVIAWDTDLSSGYESHFLTRVANGGATHYEDCVADGLAEKIREIRPAVLLVTGYSSRFDRKAIRIARRSGLPILFRAETTDHAIRRTWWRGIIRTIWLMRFYSVCAGLLYIGLHSYKHYRRLAVPQEKLTFSPYCVSTVTFRCSEEDRTVLRQPVRESLKLKPDSIVIIFCGKLSHRKGVDLLPDAVRLLPCELANKVVLVYLGEGELRADLAEKVAASPPVQTRFLGFQNQSMLSQYYHAADLFVLPSREGETWGLVVNEALHHGVPCVASDAVGSVPDLVIPGETGEVCRAGDVSDLSDTIQRATSLIGRQEVRVRCRGVVAKYTTEAAANGIATAFRSIAG